MSSLKGKVAVVTGASRGIGRAIALKLASSGCHVAYNYLTHDKQAKALANELEKLNVKVKCSQVDVRDQEKVKEWVQDVKSEWGQLDILINNAGIVCDKPLMMMTPEDWRSVLDTNLNGMFNVARSCIVTFMKQKSGNIVNISSVSGIIGLPGQTNYSASKGGMNAFTKALAKEVAGYGIRVNAIAPGFIDTDILATMKEDLRAQIIERIPVGRLGSPDDIAAGVLYLLSDEAKYVTGQIIQIDGGLALR